MSESCSNCGADLYEGQQFCRRCGVQVGVPAAGGDAPTQLFPQEARPAQSAAVGTSHMRSEAASRLETGPVGVQQPTSYYPPANFQKTSPLVGQPFGSQPLAIEAPAPKKRRGVWLLALFVVFVLGAGLASGAALLWWRATHTKAVKIVKVGPQAPPGVPSVPDIPDVPPVPADLGDRIKEALKSAGVPLPLDEAGATVTGTDTVFTQTYELDADSAFVVHAVSGNVTVTGGEGDQVVVKVTKHGGSPQQREAARVLASKTDEGLTILTAPGQAGGVSVSYEIKVPRELRRLEVSSERGDIKVGEFDGSAALNLTNGSISVASGGEVRGRLTNGDINITYTGRHDDPQEFAVVNGGVNVSFADEPQVDLKAESVNGDIKAEDGLGAGAEKRGNGRRLDAELGGGGAPLTLKVVNGDIRLKK